MVSVDKLTEITTRKNAASRRRTSTRPRGAGAGTGRPERAAEAGHDQRDRRLVGLVYSNPEYDRLFKEQTGEFDQAKRKALVQHISP